MKQQLTPQAIREAIDDCLSGINTSLPSVRTDVLMHLKGEPRMKKKLSAGVVLAIVLMILMMSAAIAAGLGLFGQLGSREHADERLNGLETVSTKVDQTFITEEGVTVTIDQAYYDGNRVFISYAVEGPFDQLELGEGKPEIAAWDWELPGETYGQTFGSDSASHQQMVAHLDGSAPPLGNLPLCQCPRRPADWRGIPGHHRRRKLSDRGWQADRLEGMHRARRAGF